MKLLNVVLVGNVLLYFVYFVVHNELPYKLYTCHFCRVVKSDRAIILMNLCVALLIALALFLAGVGRTDNEVVYQFCQF